MPVPIQFPPSPPAKRIPAPISKPAPVVPRPAPVALPPLSQIIAAKRIAVRLMLAAQSGRLTFTNGNRDKDQLRQIAAQGYITRIRNRENFPTAFFPTPAHPAIVEIATLRTLETLAARSTWQRPCELLSLYRPRRNAASREPHSRGFALDIRAFDGFVVDNDQPDRCVLMFLALMRALPAGQDYRLGVPKPPRSDQRGLLPPLPRGSWPFLPPPLPRVIRLFGRFDVVMPRKAGDGTFRQDKRGNFLQPEILRWENERAAPLMELRDARVRQAIRSARRRGANVWLLFPDAADHVHLDIVAPR